MAKEKNKINFEPATVLAFEKKLIPSDACMYSMKWDGELSEDAPAEPIRLTEKAVRGTISNRMKPAQAEDPAKLNANIQKPNLQLVDTASLGPEDNTLKVVFTLKVLPNAWEPSACNSEEHRKAIEAIGREYMKETGFKELARRYALNLANGRFLWRNRVGAREISVVVREIYGSRRWVFDAYAYDLRGMATKDPKIDELAADIADALCGRFTSLLLEVTAYAKLGNGQEVYPSQELILNKTDHSKSKVLYHVNGTAAIHAQKLGNALRTIDTWYPKYSKDGIGPIAVEPYGAVTGMGKAYRLPKDKTDFYSLFDAWSQGKKPDRIEDEHYVMAVLVRGGVFSTSGKD